MRYLIVLIVVFCSATVPLIMENCELVTEFEYYVSNLNEEIYAVCTSAKLLVEAEYCFLIHTEDITDKVIFYYNAGIAIFSSIDTVPAKAYYICKNRTDNVFTSYTGLTVY